MIIFKLFKKNMRHRCFRKKTLLLSLRQYYSRVPHSTNISITVFSADSDDLTQTCSYDLRRSLFGLPGARRTCLNDFWSPGNKLKKIEFWQEKSMFWTLGWDVSAVETTCLGYQSNPLPLEEDFDPTKTCQWFDNLCHFGCETKPRATNIRLST